MDDEAEKRKIERQQKMKSYDYIFIGSGPAVRQYVKLLANVPAKTALVIEQDKFGGTCPNYGCAPKAFFEGAMRTALQSAQLAGRGIKTPSKIDWSKLMRAKLSFFADWPKNLEKTVQKNAATLHGQAQFIDNHTIQVNQQKYFGKKIVLGIGQAPRPLTFPGSNLCKTSNDVFAMKDLPHQIAIIGAGYVAIELATLLNAAGSQVTIVQHNKRVLKHFDQGQVQKLAAVLQQRGVKFAFNKNTTRLEQTGTGYLLSFSDQTQLKTDMVINCAGRQPVLGPLHLEKTDIKADAHGIIVDPHLQTAAPDVYALGDAISKRQPKLTPVGQFEARYLFSHLEKHNPQPIKYPVIATGVFSFPQIAEAGVLPTHLPQGFHAETHSFQDGLHGGQNDLHNSLKLIFDQDDYLVGISEISDNAIDDVNYYVPLMGLHLKQADLQQKFVSIFPSSGASSVNLLH